MDFLRPVIAGLVLACLGLTGCSSDKPKPLPLEPLQPRVEVRTLWQTKVGNVSFPLSVSASEGPLVLADDAGTVLALETSTGRELWRVNLATRIAAGVGSDGRWAAVVSRDNELIVVESGRERWRAKLPTRALSSPFVAGERVFAMTVNRVVHAYDVRDGRRIWTFDRPGDALALGQPGVTSAFKDTLLVGQGPRLVGVDPTAGTARWEAAIGNPRGTNEVERLADLVGPAARAGSMVCARSFQSAVGCVDAQRGVVQWTRNLGGWQPVLANEQLVVATDASDRINAWRTLSGESLWSQEKLMYRSLGAGVILGKTVMLGESNGTLHFLDSSTGSPVLRLPTDGSPAVAARRVGDTGAVVVTRSGLVLALRQD